MKYFYVKICRSCNDMYYRKEISEEQFSVLEENDNIDVGCEDDEWEARIQSCCTPCANEHHFDDNPRLNC